jgi:UDP-3-O-[3-hydroxymyristoyl] glucosamine N-acyltransferase
VVSPAPEGSLVLALSSAADGLEAAGYSVIESEHPKRDLARVYREFFRVPPPEGAHASAILGGEVALGRNVSIGPGCVVDGRVELGDGVVLAANVRVQGPATLGDGVRIGSCAVIGEEAFSFGFGDAGEAVRFPSTGGVEIGSGVEIGPSTTVAAGIFDPTRIERGAKLADLVSISNAVQIGRNAVVTARVAVSGRARIGAECWIGQSAAIRQGVRVGDGALVGMGAVVVNDVPAGVVVMGNPAVVKGKR